MLNAKVRNFDIRNVLCDKSLYLFSKRCLNIFIGFISENLENLELQKCRLQIFKVALNLRNGCRPGPCRFNAC